MQAYAVKDAGEMLQQYTRLRSGTQATDFLMRIIEEAERRKTMETKRLAMLVFCAHLSDSARHYVLRFMAEYLRFGDSNVSVILEKKLRPLSSVCL